MNRGLPFALPVLLWAGGDQSNVVFASPELEWVTQTGSTDYDEGKGVAVSSSEDIYVTGNTLGNLGGQTNTGR